MKHKKADNEISFEKRAAQKLRRRLRRIKRVRKLDRRLHIINYGDWYAPHLGYIDWGFDGKTLLHSGYSPPRLNYSMPFFLFQSDII